MDIPKKKYKKNYRNVKYNIKPFVKLYWKYIKNVSLIFTLIKKLLVKY